jgi:hypothetical protein
VAVSRVVNGNVKRQVMLATGLEVAIATWRASNPVANEIDQHGSSLLELLKPIK